MYGMNSVLTRLPRAIHLDAKSRYFVLHAATNLYVMIAHAKDVWKTFKEPEKAAFGEAPKLGPLAAVTALHVFHVVSTKKLDYSDKLHHAIMIGCVAPLGYIIKGSALLGTNMFFTTGLPGFISYLMLVACRCNIMSYVKERNINAVLNTWIRAPGCVAHAVLCLVAYSRVRKGYIIQGNMLPWHYSGVACLVLAAASYWNGMYFQSRVVRSAERLMSGN